MSSKVLFWISGALTTFCIAHSLQKKIDSDFFAIVDSYDNPKSFFQKQQLVKFKNNWFYHDHIQSKEKPDLKYLSDFEKKYDITLWELAINERIFYRFNPVYKFSDDEILSILEQECRLFDKILTELNPDFLIMYEPTLHQEELLYRMCKKLGIKILLFNQPNFSRCIISENPRMIDLDIKLNEIPFLNKNFNELREYRKSFSNYKIIQNYTHKFKVSNLELIKSTINFLINKNVHIQTHYTHRGRTKIKVLKDEIRKKLKRKFRYSFMNQNLETKIKADENFIYFPLGVDEERNLLIATPYYTNQIEIIRSIAKSLPIGHKLYVKENPSQKIRYWRSISEYREIMNIPNVRLFHPDASPELLFEKCSLVITINGTSGFDAAFYGKPSIIFSNLGYSILPSVYTLNSIQELPKLILEALGKKVDSKPLEQYLNILHDHSFDFDPMDFENKYNAFFYHDGHYLDVSIPESKMMIFLEENKTTLDKLASEFEKKIK
jgi:capsule polysaccharide modification protein KpsS